MCIRDSRPLHHGNSRIHPAAAAPKRRSNRHSHIHSLTHGTSCCMGNRRSSSCCMGNHHSTSTDSTTKTLHTARLKLSLIHISEPTRLLSISYAVFCLK